MRVARAYARPPESRKLSLTLCDGRPNLDVLDELSILARPKGVERPSRAALRRFRRAAPAARRARFVAPGIARLHPGLLTRLQALAKRWPGRAIQIVSGYRPKARSTSRHRHARALDLRIEGVHRRFVARFARTLPETGVGYYPNSTFTHVDVRARSVYWVDRSGPGERPDYGPWPPPAEEERQRAERTVAEATGALRAELDAMLGDLRELRARLDGSTGPALAPASEARTAADDLPRQEVPDDDPADTSADEGVARVDAALSTAGDEAPEETTASRASGRSEPASAGESAAEEDAVGAGGREVVVRYEPEGGGARNEDATTAVSARVEPSIEPLPRPEPEWTGGIRAVEGAAAAWSQLPASRRRRRRTSAASARPTSEPQPLAEAAPPSP